MRKVLLINPLVREWAKPNVFPTGLGYVATRFLQNNWDVVVADMNADRGTEPPYDNYDLIGITGIVTQYEEVKTIARELSMCFDAPIIAGGPLATSVPELLLTKTEVDACVIGEGEHVVDFLSRLEGFKGIEGKMLKDKHVGSISDFEIPAYEYFPIETYITNPIAADNTRKWIDGSDPTVTSLKRRSLNMIGSRGCPYNCIFCYHNYMGQGWRKREDWDIIEEMNHIKECYDVDYIHFTDDAFFCSAKKMKQFCLKKKHDQTAHGIKWSCGGRANVVTENVIKTMADAGCIGICYGLESGSQKILDRLNKKVTIEQYERAIELNKKYFSYEDYTFIIGSPGETPDTIQESIDFCKRNDITPTAAFFMTPYPGTPLFREMVQDGIINPKNLDLMEDFVSSLGEQGEQMVWNFTQFPDSEVMQWHEHFLRETGAWNAMKH